MNAVSDGRSTTRILLCGSVEDVRAVAATAETTHAWRELAPVGIITSEQEPGSLLTGLPVLAASLEGGLANADEAIAAAVLCGAPDRAALRAFLKQATDHGLRAMVASVNDGRVSVRRLRIADLLHNAPSTEDRDAMRAAVAGKRVLVTGAGGSIGSELCRQIAALGPARLTLLENSEFNLFTIDQELAGRSPLVARGRALCDVRDPDAVSRWFKRERPDIVLHVAALKHVPLVEEFAGEGALTNVLGTRNIAEAARAHGAHMLFVSTDKAASPASAMGASKRTAEMLCQALDRQSSREGGSRFIVARLGNVLGSAGSVSPMFERQISARGPVTITHQDVARFFITIPQAATFLLQALAAGLAPDAARGAVLVLDMGEPVRVVDLARDMIRLRGLRPDRDIAIQFVGLRPGEKLTEQLIDEREAIVSQPGDAIMAVRSDAPDLAALNSDIDKLVLLARAGHDELVKQRLRALVGAEREIAAAI